jgi:hypothetical protein
MQKKSYEEVDDETQKNHIAPKYNLTDELKNAMKEYENLKDKKIIKRPSKDKKPYLFLLFLLLFFGLLTISELRLFLKRISLLAFSSLLKTMRMAVSGI